jgi:hypothetical protein
LARDWSFDAAALLSALQEYQAAQQAGAKKALDGSLSFLKTQGWSSNGGWLGALYSFGSDALDSTPAAAPHGLDNPSVWVI